MSAKQARFQIVDIVASHEAADQDDTPDRHARPTIPLDVRDRLPVSRVDERPGPVHSRTAGGCRGRGGGECPPSLPATRWERPVPIEARSTGWRRRISRRQASAGHDRRGRETVPAPPAPPLAGRKAVGFRGPHPAALLHTQMGKGAVTGGSNLYMGTAALSEGDYVHEAD